VTREPDELERIIAPLIERAKELECLYRIDELLGDGSAPEAEAMAQVVRTMPSGWQHSRLCQARVRVGKSVYETPGFELTPWLLEASIVPEDEPAGSVQVCYREATPQMDEGPFLSEERRLIETIAKRIGLFLLQRRLREAHAGMAGALRREGEAKPAWRIVLDFLTHSDMELLHRINRRMINHLCWKGIPGSSDLLVSVAGMEALHGRLGDNAPLHRGGEPATPEQIDKTFEVARRHLPEAEILRCIQGWINEEKCLFLVQTLENPESGLAETGEALRRFLVSGLSDRELQPAVQRTVRVGLIRRYLLDQPEFISLAKPHIAVEDMPEITDRLVFPGNSHGRVGGKGAGLFLAHRVLRGLEGDRELFANLCVPKTWYVVSDGILAFIHYNRLEEVYNRKYMDLEQVRRDYPNIIQVFKNSAFPPEMSKQLGAALDEFGDQPIVVRSSSLLEDRTGASFAGKYKSLFLANQGTKRERLAALQDAIAEIYASVFGPDPIEYRAERGLLDFNEEMGVLIQGVVGRRVGPWFTPLFSGVAFGSNEYRWSPRLRREDGLIRLVPGLGTRAVDRMSDDYPVLLSPGQPTLRVSTAPADIERYAPRRMDVIDLESNSFATIEAEQLLRRFGSSLPGARDLISLTGEGIARTPTGLGPDWENDRFAVTFEGMLSRTPFMKQINRMLTALREAFGYEVDLEFASDGESLSLVQCRPQSRSGVSTPAAIPREIPRDRLLFASDRDIANGLVEGISHIVYVDPAAYDALPDLRLKREVARVVGRLNGLLPRKRFILMGPGRWGSRGDISLGVPVTYSEISNTAMLIEIARASGSYVPELSFGTHFFQDMVEAGIRYLPLYPDAPGGMLNEAYLRNAANRLEELLPAAASLAPVVRVIQVDLASPGLSLSVMMNGEIERAVGVLVEPHAADGAVGWGEGAAVTDHAHWRWEMAHRIAEAVDHDRFGVRGVYLVGGVRDGHAGPATDLDLVVHDSGDPSKRASLETWLAGWDRALAAINEMRTGLLVDRLLDIRYASDEEVRAGTGAATLLASPDRALALPSLGAPRD